MHGVQVKYLPVERARPGRPSRVQRAHVHDPRSFVSEVSLTFCASVTVLPSIARTPGLGSLPSTSLRGSSEES